MSAPFPGGHRDLDQHLKVRVDVVGGGVRPSGLRLIVIVRRMQSPLMVPWTRRLAILAVWGLVAASLGYSIVRVFGLEHGWHTYTFIAFTPYVAAASVTPVIVAVAWRQWVAAAVALLATVSFACVLTPRVFGSPDSARGPVLRVMSANMKLGRADPSAIVRMAASHRVDVLALQEFTYQAQVALRAAGIARLFPYSEEDPFTGATGSAVFSRYPLTQTGHTAPGDAFEQAYGIVTVPGAQPVYVRSIHPHAPTLPANIPHVRRALAAEPPAAPHGQMRILIGDFNSTLDHAYLRKLIGTGYHDAAAEVGDGLVPTWPYDGRDVPKITLDHVLVDSRIGVTSFAAQRNPNSDHRAIFATLTLPRA